MEFKNDIFISYAQLDDEPVESHQGWISFFHESLKTFISQYLGKEPKIWRDTQLRGHEDFSKEIIEILENVAILISILSPRYVESSWCKQEIKKFFEIVEQPKFSKIANQSRVFKVMKFPVPLEMQRPKQLQKLLGYDFYEIDPRTGRPKDIRPEFGRETKAKFYRKIADLAYDIKDFLTILKKEGPNPATTKKQIYLAETTFDLAQEREMIKRELMLQGYDVIPHHALPHNPEFQRVVSEHLATCQLSIHLVGKRYGIIPEGEKESVVVLQHQLARAHQEKHPDFMCLRWMPVDSIDQEPRQKVFIKTLQDDVELLQISLEEFKSIIKDKLTSSQQSIKKSIPDDLIKIYMICDQRDLEDFDKKGNPLTNYFFDRGFEVIPSVFEGDENQLRQYHQNNLRDCDAVVIYYGKGSELWLQTKLRELRKASYGRTRPMSAKAVYVNGFKTNKKQNFRTLEAIVIRNFEEFSPSKLDPFLAKLL